MNQSEVISFLNSEANKRREEANILKKAADILKRGIIKQPEKKELVVPRGFKLWEGNGKGWVMPHDAYYKCGGKWTKSYEGGGKNYSTGIEYIVPDYRVVGAYSLPPAGHRLCLNSENRTDATHFYSHTTKKWETIVVLKDEVFDVHYTYCTNKPLSDPNA